MLLPAPLCHHSWPVLLWGRSSNMVFAYGSLRVQKDLEKACCFPLLPSSHHKRPKNKGLRYQHCCFSCGLLSLPGHWDPYATSQGLGIPGLPKVQKVLPSAGYQSLAVRGTKINPRWYGNGSNYFKKKIIPSLSHVVIETRIRKVTWPWRLGTMFRGQGLFQ